MQMVKNYKIQNTIFNSNAYTIYRAVHLDNKKSVILKMLNSKFALEERSILNLEYDIAKKLSMKCALKPINLEETDQDLLFIVYEDIRGQSLKKTIQSSSLSIDQLIDIAILLAEALHEIHSSSIIHKFFNPNNIIINILSKQIKVIGFKRSVQLRQEFPVLINTISLKEELPFLSPEQTGYMNRMIDYRSDYYTLGMTFFEMFANKFPFNVDNNYETILFHLSEKPENFFNQIENLPQVIAEIIFKLISKNAEDRYQSTKGLIADLNECKQQLEKHKTVESFPLTRKDFPIQLNISQKIYGREKEFKSISEILKRIKNGAKEMLLVSGPQSIGKTFLIRDFQCSITCDMGFLVYGKYDQFQTDIPYSGLIKAIRDLIRQLESGILDINWKEGLIDNLKSDIKIIENLLPELNYLLDNNESEPLYNTKASLNTVLHKLLRFLSSMDFYLTIFLDDIHWIDNASLKLIEDIMLDDSIKNLLLICVYRKSDINKIHPLMLSIDFLKKESAIINSIELNHLQLNHISEFLKDTFTNASSNAIKELAEEIGNKTKGSPFQIVEFLKYLDKKTAFVNNINKWQWDINEIKILEFNDEIDLMKKQIELLSQNEKDLLLNAACLGSQFEHILLKIVCRQLFEKSDIDFQKIVSQGLIVPVTHLREIKDIQIKGYNKIFSQEYKFSHDSIQEAAYSFLSEELIINICLKIGIKLKQNIVNYENHSILFCIVNNLNKGIDYISHKDRETLSHLNYLAGTRAKLSFAFESALKYLTKSIELLDQNSWSTNYKQTLKIKYIAADTARLYGDYKIMEQIINDVLENASNLHDKIDFYEIQIMAALSLSKFSEAIRIGIDILNQLNINITEKPGAFNLFRSIYKVALLMYRKKISDLDDLPVMTDPIKIKAMRILFRLYTPAYQTDSKLILLIVLNHTYLSLKYGNTKESPFAYISYGIVLIRFFNKIDAGFELGKIAFKIISKLDLKNIDHDRLILNFLNNLFINHWKDDLNSILQSFLKIFQDGIESGEYEYATTSLALHSAYSFFMGKKLTNLYNEMTLYAQTMRKYKQDAVYANHIVLTNVVSELIGCKEKNAIEISNIDKNLLSILIQNFSKHFFALLFNNYSDAYNYMKESELYIENVFGTMTYVLFFCTSSLAMIGVYPDIDKANKKQILKKIKSNLKKLKKYAEMAQKNYQEKYTIVKAEYLRITGNQKKAVEYYDIAIQAAKNNNSIHFQAISNELAANFYISINKSIEASVYLNEAIRCYITWGAYAKVNQLKDNKQYTSLFENYKNENINKYKQIIELSKKINNYSDAQLFLKSIMNSYRNIIMVHEIIILFQFNNEYIYIKQLDDYDNIDYSFNSEYPEHITQNHEIFKQCYNYISDNKQKLVFNISSEIKSFIVKPDDSTELMFPMSILCIPIMLNDVFSGMIYLDNRCLKKIFNPIVVELIELFSKQVGDSLNNFFKFKNIEHINKAIDNQMEEYSKMLVYSKHNKMGEIASGIAHELIQPLNIINANLFNIKDYFQYDAPEDSEITLVQNIYDLIDNTSVIIENMRLFSRLKSDCSLYSNLDKEIRNILPFFDDTFRIQNIQHELIIPQELPIVRIDAQKFHQAAVHLILNAIHAVEEKSIIVKSNYQKKIVMEMFCENNKFVIFEISDNGKGMTQDVIDNCFNPFFSTKEPGKGIGMGLFYVNTIAKEFQFNIKINSIEGQGTKFQIIMELKK